MHYECTTNLLVSTQHSALSKIFHSARVAMFSRFSESVLTTILDYQARATVALRVAILGPPTVH